MHVAASSSPMSLSQLASALTSLDRTLEAAPAGWPAAELTAAASALAQRSVSAGIDFANSGSRFGNRISGRATDAAAEVIRAVAEADANRAAGVPFGNRPGYGTLLDETISAVDAIDDAWADLQRQGSRV